MKSWLVVAAAAAALPAVLAPSWAQTSARSVETRAAASEISSGPSSARKASASRTRRTESRTSASFDLPPGYHKVDHQTGLPNPSIPSR
jgi:hypothetical protein